MELLGIISLATIIEFGKKATGAYATAEKVLKFLGVIKDKSEFLYIKRLSTSELDAGIRNLEYVRGSYNPLEYINPAIQNFTKAISIERGKRQVVAYLALALCFHIKEEEESVERTLREFGDLDICKDWVDNDNIGMLKFLSNKVISLKFIIECFSSLLLDSDFREECIFYELEIKDLRKSGNSTTTFQEVLLGNPRFADFITKTIIKYNYSGVSSDIDGFRKKMQELVSILSLQNEARQLTGGYYISPSFYVRKKLGLC